MLKYDMPLFSPHDLKKKYSYGKICYISFRCAINWNSILFEQAQSFFCRHATSRRLVFFAFLAIHFGLAIVGLATVEFAIVGSFERQFTQRQRSLGALYYTCNQSYESCIIRNVSIFRKLYFQIFHNRKCQVLFSNQESLKHKCSHRSSHPNLLLNCHNNLHHRIHIERCSTHRHTTHH